MKSKNMKKNQLTTHKSSVLLLGKSKRLMKITKKLLESKSKELINHKDITIIGDLMWEKETRKMSWYEGMEYAKNLRLGGYDDWRLPTHEELAEIVKQCGGEYENSSSNGENELYQTNYKAIGFSASYWSSTVGSKYSAKLVSFYGCGSWQDKSDSFFGVRCVRDGQ